MENISNKVSYVKGLIDGLKIDEASNEGKIFKAILEILDEVNECVDDLYDYQDEMSDRIDLIDDDLATVEDVLLEEDDECDGECCGEFYEMECPKCGETICIDEDALINDESIVCPNCDEEIELDFDCDCDCDDDCDCGCHCE